MDKVKTPKKLVLLLLVLTLFSVSTVAETSFEIETREATNIGVDSATLNGVIVDSGGQVSTEYAFQLRVEGADDWITVDEGEVLSYPSPTYVSHTVDFLEPDITYEFRFIAYDWVGIVFGDVNTFTTFEPLPEEAEESFLDDPYPEQGQGVLTRQMREDYLGISVDSNYSGDCFIDATIHRYDKDDDDYTDGVYSTTFSGSCDSLKDLESEERLLSIVNREKADYRTEYTLFADYAGEIYELDNIQVDWRYGNILDLLSGMLEVEFGLFRVLLATIITALVGVWSFAWTHRNDITVVVTVPFIAFFILLGWFPEIVVVGLMFGLAVGFALLGGRMTPSSM